VPVGAHARVSGATVALEAGVFAPGGRRALRVEVQGREPSTTGAEAARRLLASGAGEILAALERAPRLAWERA
jgi:porphobilinogen deaminase